jgi:hypothetical protein
MNQQHCGSQHATNDDDYLIKCIMTRETVKTTTKYTLDVDSIDTTYRLVGGTL